MLATDDPPTDIVCFHCQQAVEKCLKAFLVRHDQDVPRTHDLPHLIAMCAAHRPDLAGIEDDARTLTDYAVETRYADDWRDIPVAEAREAMDTAERLVVFIEHGIHPVKPKP